MNVLLLSADLYAREFLAPPPRFLSSVYTLGITQLMCSM